MQFIANCILWLLVITLALSMLRIRNKVYMPFKLKELMFSDFGATLDELFPVSQFRTIEGEQISINQNDGKQTIILVTSPTCGTCKTLYPIINPFFRNNGDRYSFISLMYGDLQEIREIAQTYNLAVPIVQLENELSLESIKTDRFPFGYLLSSEGKVISKGLITNEEQFNLLRTWVPKQPKKNRFAFYRDGAGA